MVQVKLLRVLRALRAALIKFKEAAHSVGFRILGEARAQLAGEDLMRVPIRRREVALRD